MARTPGASGTFLVTAVATTEEIRNVSQATFHVALLTFSPGEDPLAASQAVAVEVLGQLERVLDRFRIHLPRLRFALERVQAGDTQWFTGASIESFHTVWFELHEDLLATLGLDRAAES